MEYYINNLSKEELQDLKVKIEYRLKLLETQRELAELENEVETNKYAFRKHHIDCKYDYIALEVGIGIYTWDKEDKNDEDWHLSGRKVEQKPWFKYFSCIDLNDFKIEDIDHDDDEWEFDDWDDPAYSTGWAIVYLYFKQSELPPEGKKITILHEDFNDEPCIMYVKDSIVYINDVSVSRKDEFRGSFFILHDN